jgi:hypothetical protein
MLRMSHPRNCLWYAAGKQGGRAVENLTAWVSLTLMFLSDDPVSRRVESDEMSMVRTGSLWP